MEGRRAQLRRAVAEPIGEIAVVGASAQAEAQNREPSRVLSFLSDFVCLARNASYGEIAVKTLGRRRRSRHHGGQRREDAATQMMTPLSINTGNGIWTRSIVALDE